MFDEKGYVELWIKYGVGEKNFLTQEQREKIVFYLTTDSKFYEF